MLGNGDIVVIDVLHLSCAVRLQVLEMLSYLTYYGSGISDRLWALWPQIEAAVNEWAVDYWENILVGVPPYHTIQSCQTASALWLERLCGPGHGEPQW